MGMACTECGLLTLKWIEEDSAYVNKWGSGLGFRGQERGNER